MISHSHNFVSDEAAHLMQVYVRFTAKSYNFVLSRQLPPSLSLRSFEAYFAELVALQTVMELFVVFTHEPLSCEFD